MKTILPILFAAVLWPIAFNVASAFGSTVSSQTYLAIGGILGGISLALLMTLDREL